MQEALQRIHFQQLEIFFCAVETESFTKTAHRLNMTQSAVSKSIAKLEQELDLKLFTRQYRELHVTEAGRELYRSWREQVRLISDAYERVFALQHSEDCLLRVGATNTTDFDTYFWPIITTFRQKFPECRLQPESDNMERLIEKLDQGELDVIFVPDFMKYRMEALGLDWKWAAKGEIQILLPPDHPLADQELTLEKLKDETILFLDEGTYPENIRFVTELFAEEGYEIQTSDMRFRTPEGITDFYDASDGILLTDCFFKYENSRQKVIRKPLTGYQNGIICGYRRQNKSRYVKNMLRVLAAR